MPIGRAGRSMQLMTRTIRLSLLAGLMLTASACSATASAPFLAGDEEDERSAYGAYLAARMAGSERDTRNASDYYATALDRAPDSSFLLERAFIAALMAGDTDRAVGTAADAAHSADESRLARLFLAADALTERRWEDTRTWLEVDGFGPFNSFLADMMRDWADAGSGQADAAISRTESTPAPGFALAFQTLHRALLLDHAGRAEEAGTVYSAALGQTPFRRMAVELFGANLERRGERGDAIALYQGYLASEPNEPTITAALQRAEAGRRAPRALTLQQAAARALYGPAALFASQAEMDLAVIYLRLAQRLDPDYASTRALLAATLERLEMTEAALAEYAAVPEGPFRRSADIDRIYLIARTGDPDAAMTAAQELVARDNDIEARMMLADLNRWSGNLEAAQAGYGEVIAERLANGQTPNWQLYYFRAAALEQLDRWDEAEPLFLAALEIAPNEAQILNYLGYIWVERGENIEQAFSMIGRAVAMEPDAGYIVDSLGWAYYVRGDYASAVTHLERAAALSPDSPTINFHLGDAYARVGRHLEARFQWQRALELDPTEEETEQLQARLVDGLPEPGSPTAIAEQQVTGEP